MIPSKKRLPSPTNELPCPAISVITYILVIMEAMVCGIPVVATRCPSGPEEIITNDVNGLLVPVAEDRALAEAMLRLLNDRDLAVKLAKAARKKINDFNALKMVEKYEALFTSK